MVFTRGSRSRKFLAGAASMALATGGVVALTAAPATAVSGELNYNCATSIGAAVFKVVVDTDLPETMVEGESFTPTVTAKVTVQSSVRNAIHFVGHRFADGGSVSHSTVNGVPRTTNMTVPLTPIPHYTEGPFIVTATGTGDPIVAGAAGETITVAAGNFTSNLVVMKNEDRLDESPQTTECTIAPDQDVTVDVIQVVSATPDPEPEPEPGPVQVTVGSDILAGTDLPVSFSESANGRTFGFELEDGSQMPVGAPLGLNGAAAAPPAFPLWLGEQTISNGLANVAIPSNVPEGQYTLVIYEILDGERSFLSDSPLNIAAASVEVPEAPIDNVGDDDEAAGDEQLERTGGTTSLLSVLGVLAMLTGGAALVLRRRFGQSI